MLSNYKKILTFFIINTAFAMEQLVTPEDVTNGYRLILGREPENSQIFTYYEGQTISQFRSRLLSSQEFKTTAFFQPPSHYDYPYPRRSRPLEETSTLLESLRSSEQSSSAILGQAIALAPFFRTITVTAPTNPQEPQWVNGFLPSLDSISIYTTLVTLNPKIYLEIGSGNSTKFARKAIGDHGLRTKIISIDPYPRAEIDEICDSIIRQPLENLTDFSIFSELEATDVLFFDGSHRAFQNSDVTVFFMNILPRLKPGVRCGVHDIFLPNDYPETWKDRWYNEQYMLAAYLLGGTSTIIFPSNYLAHSSQLHRSPEIERLLSSLFSLLPEPIEKTGCALWLEKK